MVLREDTNSIYLAIALHAHQPVDNFDHIFREAFNKSYQPFIETLSRFPGVKISLHISGSLIDWLLLNEPGFISQLKNLVKSGQIEILTAGYYEPILILIPDRDKVAQINLHKLKMKALFGVTPLGLWLTERVWEPSLPRPLSQAGISYTVVDDEHFKMAGKEPEDLWGYYITEEEASKIAVFPGSKFLRYSMPFKLVEDTIHYLKKKLQQKKTCITFADDLEKFGFWPHTYEWVYQEGWLYKFFQALKENRSWIKTVHFKEILEKFAPAGRIYLPCGSYSEMMEWCDNMFRNFLVRYPESNQLHKRMFHLSRNINQNCNCLNPEELEEAKAHLYKSQNNDVYWHGIFGGLYLTHLRHNAYSHIIKAEKILEQAFESRFPLYEVKDYDLDGRKELIFKTQIYNIYIAPASGGTITEIDYKPQETNLVNTLTRRPEKYHQKILKKEAMVSSSGKDLPQSIHNLQVSKEKGLEESLIYDPYRKVSWIEHLYPGGITPDALLRNQVSELYPFWEKYYRYEVEGNLIRLFLDTYEIELIKELKIEGENLLFEYKVYSKNKQAKFFSSEFNFLFYDSEFLSQSKNVFRELQELRIVDSWFNLVYEMRFDARTGLFFYPVETISDSESGIERTYQGSSIYLIWELNNGNLETKFQIKLGRK